MLKSWMALTAVFAFVQGQGELFGGDPLGSDAPIFATTTHPKPPTPFWGDLPGPYETNIWWLNLVLDGGDQPVVSYPYTMTLGEFGMSLCFPDKVVDETSVATVIVKDWEVGADESLGSRTLTKRDHFSATMTYENGLEIPIVRGMPYATFKYTNIRPKLTTIWTIISVNGGTEGSEEYGTKFNIELDNGQRWIMYTSSDVTLSWSESVIVLYDALGYFTGTMRMAVMVDGVSETDLDIYSTKVPIGGSIEASSLGDSADIVINWETEGTGDLLMVALPHHMDVLAVQVTADYKLNGIRGDMTGIVGDSWLMNEPLTVFDWFAPNGIDPSRAESIRAALNEDIIGNDVVAGDPYFGGKQMAKLARLSLIAEEMGEESLAQQFRDKLQPVLESWLDGTNFDALLYDTTWGGIVSTNSLVDSGADFGNGYYQDHHFHYGYHIYAAAVLAKADTTWGSIYEDQVMHYVRDIIEPSGADPQYPFTRSKDWYTGHSWANGIVTAAPDSKNQVRMQPTEKEKVLKFYSIFQESTSEGVNAWYALYLYGLVMNNDRVRDLGRLALATEIRSAQKYWQITSADDIYPAPFDANKVVGIVWSTRVDYNTWFGSNIEFIHCIQMLPFVPISEELLRKEWIIEEYPVLAEAFDTADEAWRGYIIMAHAVVDPQAAWDEAQLLTRFDDGNTKSNTYYWIASQPY